MPPAASSPTSSTSSSLHPRPSPPRHSFPRPTDPALRLATIHLCLPYSSEARQQGLQAQLPGAFEGLLEPWSCMYATALRQYSCRRTWSARNGGARVDIVTPRRHSRRQAVRHQAEPCRVSSPSARYCTPGRCARRGLRCASLWCRCCYG